MTTNIQKMIAALKAEQPLEEIAVKLLDSKPLTSGETLLMLAHTDRINKLKSIIKDNRDDI